MKFFTTCAMSAIIGLTSLLPVEAAPMAVKSFSIGSDVQGVQYHDRRGHWKGHRGYRERRRGYRRHSDGFWYPLAAFGAGAIIGGAIANSRNDGGSHEEWCANRYRSYSVRTDTYVGNDGRRHRCNSPY
ncbi:BA14K family protein [Rhizobium sp. LjRoot30]|uniref:BA14K family protein n=1 Tax=Rhizobium sp. LjRoot30 TaxID=3342320 RepID=UPI003ECE14D8